MPGHGSSETPKENAPLHSTRTETELEPVQVRSEAKAKQSLSKERASNQPLVQTANVPVSQKEVTIVIPTRARARRTILSPASPDPYYSCTE